MKLNHSIKCITLSVFLSIILLLAGGQSYAEFIAADQSVIPGQYIVTYKPNVAANMIFGTAANSPIAAQVANDLLLQYGTGSEKKLYVYENAIEGFAARMDQVSASRSGFGQQRRWLLICYHQKPAVANMSLGGSSNASLDDAVKKSINAGISYAVAAGKVI